MTFNSCGTLRLLAATALVIGCATPPPPAPIYVEPAPRTPPPLSDPGSASATSVTIPFTQHEVVGAITGFNARWYRFRVSEPGEITLSLVGDGSQTDLDLYLYRSVDVHFRRDSSWSSRGNSSAETITADLTEGTYYIHVPIAEESVATTTFTLRGKWMPNPPLQASTLSLADETTTGRRSSSDKPKPKPKPKPIPAKPVRTDPVPKPVEVIPPAIDPGRSSALEIVSGTTRETELTMTRRIIWFKVVVREVSELSIEITAKTDLGKVIVSALDQTLSMTGTNTIKRPAMEPGTYYIRLATSLPQTHARVTVKASVLDSEGFISRH